jgi:hypothetical protein
VNEQGQDRWATRRGTLTQVTVGVAGALLYITIHFITPKPAPQSVLQPALQDGPGLLGLLFRAAHSMGNYYVQLAAFLVFVCLAVYRRNQRAGWIFAFLSGWAFPEVIIFDWLRYAALCALISASSSADHMLRAYNP